MRFRIHVDKLGLGKKIAFHPETISAKLDLSHKKSVYYVNRNFCRPKRFPGLEVEEEDIDDVGNQGDDEDGVEQVDLLYDGQVRKTVLLGASFSCFFLEKVMFRSPAKRVQSPEAV